MARLVMHWLYGCEAVAVQHEAGHWDAGLALARRGQLDT